MNTWITSDLHFYHGKIIEFCPRFRGQFSDMQHMHQCMIERWNNTVAPEDHTYILGDFAFCGAAKAAAILQQLNGTKTLVIGNHDEELANKQAFREQFVELVHYKKLVYGEHHIVMCHYPIAKWDRAHYGSLHFHGHMHGKPAGLEGRRAVDVGFDSTGHVVLHIEAAIKLAINGTY